MSRRTFVGVAAGIAAGAAFGLDIVRPDRATAAVNTYYVAKNGNDSAAGTSSAPLLTIGAAALLAQPGDQVLVRSGVYREEVIFPRGGTSDASRITYAADAGASVTITGSDVFTNWTQVSGDVWQVRIPSSYFNGFNPYAEQVHGDWFDGRGRVHRLGMVYLNGAWLPEATSASAVSSTASASWWSQVDGLVEGTAPTFRPSYSPTGFTTITAKFPGVNPNSGAVEVGVRGTVFKPAATNFNYITIRGFNLRNAAANWAAPTMGQWGLVSAYWCKGWLIEDNEIAYSRCSGIALGKYSDQYDGTRGTTNGYYSTISDAQTTGGWSFANIGGHVVRNNHIHHCGQVGVVGSLGAIGSTITGNEIYHANSQGIWTGAEMAGIKLHGAIDVVISGNHIYSIGANGIWLDWMAQGTRVLGNLLHHTAGDLFAEVDHGPILVANNIMLSSSPTWIASTGLAWAHNLFASPIRANADSRQTPYMQPHTTATIANHDVPSGAQQWVNNIIGGSTNLATWDGASASYPIAMRGNVYTKGSVKSAKEQGGVDASGITYAPSLAKLTDGWYLSVPRDEAWRTTQTLVSTASLANAPIPNQPFTNPDGSTMSISTDYFGNARNASTPFPGPFESAGGATAIKVWAQVSPTTDAWGLPPAPTVGGPGAGTDANGNITVHIRGTDNQLYQRAYNNGVWSQWASLGGPNLGTFVGSPEVISRAGRTDVLVRGTDDQLWNKNWTAAAGWSGWIALGGVLRDSPGAATDAAGNITVHVRGTDNQIWQKVCSPGGVWSGWAAIGGPNAGTFQGAPAVAARNGRTDVFVRGTDDQLWTKNWTSSAGWSGWIPLGGILADSPSAATDANGNITVHIRGTDNQIWQVYSAGTTWSSWAALGGPNGGKFTGAPATTAIVGRTDIFVRGTDDQLWQKTWNASGWSGWTALGGVLGN
ncbi:MAG TPA: right-handed parallel beta-helix repeat-containing protein [Candidatus Lumbricidophila sp.]|nr:right-handed parallel beta-helix repeat-containing protein [Candidatus Lumbricidophila sp.]